MIRQDLRWWVPLLLVAVVSSTAVYQWRLHHPNKVKLVGDYVDTIAEQLEVLRYNEQGQLIQDLKSPYAEHYSLSKTTHFKRPQVVIYPTQANRAIWQMNAGLGVLSGDKERLDLSGGVDMHEVVTGGKQLLTDKLSWYTQKKLAVTDQAIVGTEPGVKVSAVGATFDQAAGLIHLLSDVKAVYQPKVAGNLTESTSG